MSSSSDKPCSVLVTRPLHQAKHFIEQLRNRQFKVLHLPSIEIVFDSADLTETLRSDLIIFTSANAVTGANRNLQFPWNTKAKIAAIGSATADMLKQLDCRVDIVPHAAASTEALLEVIGHTANLDVTIVRGDSGRNKLFDALTDQGAKPVYQSVYKRKLPDYSHAHIATLFREGLPDIISVTSDLGLTNLLAIIPSELNLQSKPLVVNSARCARIAVEKGFTSKILVADPPGDDSQLSKILSLR